MRVGVYPGDFPPEEGGGHTFVATLLDAFFRLARSGRHQFVVFSEPAHAGALAPRCASAGVALHPLRARGIAGQAIAQLKHYSPFAYLLRGWPGRLERAARKRRTDMLWFVPGLAYEAPDIPYIGAVWDLQHRIHPWFPEVSSGGLWEHREMVYARFVRRAAHLITGTRVGAEQLQTFYQVPAERISVLPQPAPRLPAGAADAAPSPAVSGLAGERYFFYPAQFWPHKNHVNLLYALKLLADRDGVHAVLALAGSDKGNLGHVKRVAAELGLERRVHFAGFVDPADLAWLYRNAVALVLPTFFGPDNLPPLEAFALGCPVALSDYPGASEQVGDAALLFDPRSPERIAQALKTLLEDQDLRRELIRRGRERSARLSAEDYVRGVFAVLDGFESVRRCWS